LPTPIYVLQNRHNEIGQVNHQMLSLDDMTSDKYVGVEIDALFVGDADAFLVTGYKDGDDPMHILIDGGYSRDATMLREFLRDRGINRIHHLVNTHPHDDHAGGLSLLVQDHSLVIERAWIHRPETHITEAWVEALVDTVDTLAHTEAVFRQAAVREVQVVTKSLETSLSLDKLLASRSIPIREPFTGTKIGFLTVCGPTGDYYEQLLEDFPASIREAATPDALAKAFKAATAEEKPLLDDPVTDPINNSSVILAMRFNGHKLLLTADAGRPALERACADCALANVTWMQIPHHGSRSNITAALMDHFHPRTAYISASGADDHPYACVIEGFKERGAKVYSTHHPNPGSLIYQLGDCPEHPGYRPAVPL
jgi:beta-lactamase superfamily II metal-dependent hydrolase